MTRRFSRGMWAMLLYSFSKSIDDATSFTSTGGTVIQNPNDWSAERGLSSFDQRHNLSFNYTLSAPVGLHGFWRNETWEAKVLRGWTLNGAINLHSGNPRTATISGSSVTHAINGQLRAEATGVPIDAVAGGNPYFNLGAFTTPTPGTWGDAGRGHHHRADHLDHQRHAESRLAVRRKPADAAIAHSGQQRSEPRSDHGIRNHRREPDLRDRDFGFRHAQRNPGDEVQFLAMRIKGIVAFLAVVALGQQSPPKPPTPQTPPPQPGTTPTFTSTANLVIVDVTVKTKAGAVLDTLTQNDFSVLEDGKPQKISVFEIQKLSLEPAPPPEAPTLESQKELPEDPKTTISVQPNNKVQYHDKRLLVLFFDFSNMGIPDQLRAQDASLKFLDKQMTASDMVAILLFTTTVQVKTDFTADRDQLRTVIENLPIGDMADLAAMADTGDDDSEDTGAAFVADETEFNIFNTDRKLAAIEDAVKKLAKLPEKKVLIYITGGISQHRRR